LVSVVRLHLIYNELEVVGIVISAVSCQYLLNYVSGIPSELKRIDLLLFLISEYFTRSLLSLFLFLVLLLPMYLRCRRNDRLLRRDGCPLIVIDDNDRASLGTQGSSSSTRCILKVL